MRQNPGKVERDEREGRGRVNFSRMPKVGNSWCSDLNDVPFALTKEHSALGYHSATPCLVYLFHGRPFNSHNSAIKSSEATSNCLNAHSFDESF